MKKLFTTVLAVLMNASLWNVSVNAQTATLKVSGFKSDSVKLK